MALLETLAIVVLAGGGGALLSLLGIGYLVSAVRVKRSDPVDVRALRDPAGAVELEGTAGVHEDTDRSPFTDTESLVHRWRIERRRPGGGTSGTSKWATVDAGVETHPFVLDDETGAVLVEPAGANLQLETTETVGVDGGESPPATVADYLESTADLEVDDDQERRFHEARLDPGDDVHVVGPVRETGHSVDLPGGVDAVLGVEDPGDREFTLGEDGFRDFVDPMRSTAGDRFVVSNSDEAGTARNMLKKGALWFGMGVLFLAVAVGVVLFG